MNKKILICAAIATALILTACVKKEAPTEEQQEQVEVKTTEQVQQPAEFENLDAIETEEAPVITAPVVRNTITETARENRPAENTATVATPTAATKTEAQVTPATEVKKAAEVESNFTPKNTSSSQSQEDAVNDAIAAAMPALDK